MKILEIKLMGLYNVSNIILKVNDSPLTLKKNEFGSLVGVYKTEEEKVRVKINNYLNIGGVIWFLIQIFFFLISILGIFDVHRKEKCMMIDFEMDVDLKEENHITLQLNSQKKERSQAVQIQTDLVFHEVMNEYFLDSVAKRKLKVLKITKIVLTIIIIVLAAILLRKLF